MKKNNRIGRSTIVFKNKPRIESFYAIVGKKEGEGPFNKYFDEILKNDLCNQKSYELAEREILEKTIMGALKKKNVDLSDIDFMLGGDLLNQIISTSFSARHFETPLIGLYGACSTMSESLAIAAALIDGGYAKKTICATVSHFATAERQYRTPLELGNQRPPVSQWTVTGAGCTILSNTNRGNYISMATFGKVTDYGVTDANNMGAAMAPAAVDTLLTHFNDTGRNPSYYDLILTGDLGYIGKDIMIDMMRKHGFNIKSNYNDCGVLIFDKETQDTHSGGSGCACCATVFSGYVFKQLQEKNIKKVLLIATGALTNSTSAQQGESIPGIAHAISIEL